MLTFLYILYFNSFCLKFAFSYYIFYFQNLNQNSKSYLIMRLPLFDNSLSKMSWSNFWLILVSIILVMEVCTEKFDMWSLTENYLSSGCLMDSLSLFFIFLSAFATSWQQQAWILRTLIAYALYLYYSWYQ